MKLPKLFGSAGSSGPVKVGSAPKVKGAAGLPKGPSTSNVRPHLSGVSTHRLSLRGRSAFPPNPATAFGPPPAGAGGGGGPDPAQAFAGGAGPSGAAQGDMGE